MKPYPGSESFDQRTDQAGIATHFVIGYRLVTVEYDLSNVMTAPSGEIGEIEQLRG
jgi:hypothetical protein